MKHRIIASIVLAATVSLFIAGAAQAAPTSTYVQNLFITALPSAPCLTTNARGLVTSSTGCGSGGSSTVNLTGSSTANTFPYWLDVNGNLSSSSILTTNASGTRIGINTTSPGSTLDVNGTITVRAGSDNNIQLNLVQNGTNSNSFTVTTNAPTSTGLALKNYVLGESSVASDLAFSPSTAAMNALVIKANGYVGIATTTPGAPLDVESLLTSGEVARFGNFGSGSSSFVGMNGERAIFGYNATSANVNITAGSGKGFELYVNGNSANQATGTLAITVPISGNVGIGTPTPASALTLGAGQLAVPDGNASTPSYSFNSDTSTGIFYTSGGINLSTGGTSRFSVTSIGLSAGATTGVNIRTGGASATQPNIIPNRADSTTGIGADASGNVSVITGATTKVEVLNNGNVGIGTLTPSSTLTVVGTSSRDVLNVNNASGTTAIQAISSSTPNVIWSVDNNAVSVLSVSSSSAITVNSNATFNYAPTLSCFQMLDQGLSSSTLVYDWAYASSTSLVITATKPNFCL